MPSVFVLMPFASEFDDIFGGIIKQVFEDKGFSVKRADDIENQRNILQDIIAEIFNSDLIIADVTDSNPNVYYELGIAHALGRPVIHMTQDV